MSTAVDSKATSEWQYIKYRCYDCKHEGECKCRIGEVAFCGKCGSNDLVKPKSSRNSEKQGVRRDCEPWTEPCPSCGRALGVKTDTELVVELKKKLIEIEEREAM